MLWKLSYVELCQESTANKIMEGKDEKHELSSEGKKALKASQDWNDLEQ